MDPQFLDSYFTNLVLEMEASRNRLADDDWEGAYHRPQAPRDHRLLPLLTGFTAFGIGLATLGSWL